MTNRDWIQYVKLTDKLSAAGVGANAEDVFGPTELAEYRRLYEIASAESEQERLSHPAQTLSCFI